MSNSSGSPGGSTCEIYPESDHFSPHSSYQAWTPVQATPISGLFRGHSFFLSAPLHSVLGIIARCYLYFRSSYHNSAHKLFKVSLCHHYRKSQTQNPFRGLQCPTQSGTSLTDLSPDSYFSSHIGHFVISRTYCSHTYLKAFALAIPSSEILFP